VALVVVVVSHRGDWQVSQQWIVMGLLALLAWSGFVRNIRAETLVLKETEYVMFARVSGASKMRLIYRHLLPGVFNTSIVIATFATGNLILAEASLSFLGAGIPSPTPAWGLMIAEARDYVASAWWTSFFPGVAIFLVVMSLNFTGDWLRDRLDPRLREL
jgi:peptide/nickel transport system permease protein